MKEPRITFLFKIIAVYLLICLLAWLFFACTPVYADVYASGGVDFRHERGRPTFGLRADSLYFFAWEDNVAIGAAYTIGDRWQAAIGAIYVKNHERRVGTHENFLIVPLRYCGKVGCVGWAHISHGSIIGYKEQRANGGLNLLLFEVGL